MNQSLILWPLLAQVLLILLLYLRLAAVKAREIKAGNVDRRETALNQEAWPPSVRKINNNLRNQFETPMLFCFLCLVLLFLGAVNGVVIALACLWFFSRCVHAFVHTTSNVVKFRFPAFLIGVLLLAALLGHAVYALARFGA